MPEKAKTPEENGKLCESCSLCCEYVVIEIEAPKTEVDIDCIKWYLLHGLSVFIEEDGTWNVEVRMKCTKLNEKKRCSIYPSRPNICREHDQKDCERYDKSKYYKHRFTNVSEFEEFIKISPELRQICAGQQA